MWNSLGCCLTFQERPAEKPICICISNIEQLLAAKPPFSPLLWEFMRNVYPGGISCIVSKGDWLLRLGLKSSVKWLKNMETLQSKGIYFITHFPMQELGLHLTVLGPVTASWSESQTTQWLLTCVTSLDLLLSPQPILVESQTASITTWSSGQCGLTESHSTEVIITRSAFSYNHHFTFYCILSRLGQKIQGVLCDGNSNEVVASTVVNCLRIDEGKSYRQLCNFYHLKCLFFFSFYWPLCG